jgi:hypothetical protein
MKERLAMQVSYTTTVEDFVFFSRYCAKKSATLWAMFLFGWLAVPIIAVGAAVGVAMIDGLWPISIVIVISGLLFALIYPPIYRAWYDRTIRAYVREKGTRGMIGPITLILSDDRLVEITETTRSEVRWEDMKGIDVVDDYTFIFVTGLTAAIIPRHGFEFGEDYEAVRDFARSKLNSTQSQTD